MPRVHDLSHPIAPGMPVYPGTPDPTVECVARVAEQGYLEHRLTLTTHVGTHLDAPAHMLAGGRRLDSYPAAAFVGPALVLDVSAAVDGAIDRALLEPRADRIARQRWLLLRTGWSARWGDPSYFTGFPALTLEAARWLADLPLQGIGLDTPSIDRADSTDHAVHHAVLGRELLVIENLRGLAELRDREFTLCCLPLALAGVDGSPARAVALLD